MANLSKAKGFFQKIGRRNLIIFSAVLLIGAAVYLNYLWFYQPSGTIDYTGGNAATGDTDAGAPVDELDYFEAAALARETARDEALEVLQSVVDSVDETSEAKAEALDAIAKIAETVEKEANIESLLVAKGFEKCVAVIGEESASVIVSADSELAPADNAKICTVVYEQTGILPEKITIIAK